MINLNVTTILEVDVRIVVLIMPAVIIARLQEKK